MGYIILSIDELIFFKMVKSPPTSIMLFLLRLCYIDTVCVLRGAFTIDDRAAHADRQDRWWPVIASAFETLLCIHQSVNNAWKSMDIRGSDINLHVLIKL